MPSEITPSVLATNSKKSRMPERRRPATCFAMNRVVSRDGLEMELMEEVICRPSRPFGLTLEACADCIAHLGCIDWLGRTEVAGVHAFVNGGADGRLNSSRLGLQTEGAAGGRCSPKDGPRGVQRSRGGEAWCRAPAGVVRCGRPLPTAAPRAPAA